MLLAALPHLGIGQTLVVILLLLHISFKCSVFLCCSFSRCLEMVLCLLSLMAALVLCKARWGLSLAAGFWTMMAAHLRATSLRGVQKSG